jgi:nucleotide-binding universal stress UspA family protein
MYRSLLVPLDGSPTGEHALPAALGIARRARASLQVASVHVPAIGAFRGTEPAWDNQVDTAIREKEQAYLEGVVKRLEAAGVGVSSALLDGPIATALHEQATTVGADLIVMTTHGRGPLTRFWLGSVADSLIRQATMPVLVVRPHHGAADLNAPAAWAHVLIPLDGSERAESILEPAIALGTLMDADYTLMLAIEPIIVGELSAVGASFDPDFLESVQKDAQSYLDQVAARLRTRSLRVDTRVVFSLPAAAAILEEAAVKPGTLIALETHGRGGLGRLLLGSVADKVLRGASAPVLVHRGGQAPERHA